MLEILVAVSAYYVYQIIGKFLVPYVEANAFENPLKIISLESVMGCFWEQGWQDGALENWKAVIVFSSAIVLYIRDRPRYVYYRNIVLLSFAIALIVFSAFPLARPRFLPEFGFINTIAQFRPSQYDSRDMAACYNLFAAMPSLHIGWTLLIAVVYLRSTKYRWIKPLGILYPILTFFAIILTLLGYSNA